MLTTNFQLLIIVSITILPGFGFTQDDNDTKIGIQCSYRKITQCPEGKSLELYKDKLPGELGTFLLCCPREDPSIDWYLGETHNCRMTACMAMASPQSELCSTLIRSVNGTRLEYEEMFRTPCTLNGTGASGVNASISALCCTKNSLEGHLVTTLEAELNEFPHIAKIRKLPVHCGGTIYNHRYIITAAHCLVDSDTGEISDAKEFEVVLGTNYGTTNGSDYVYHVAKVIPHPKFSYLKNNTIWMTNGSLGEVERERNDSRIFYDIGLLELERNITFGGNVKMLQIAPKGFKPLSYAKSALIAGWGVLHTGNISVHLQKANFIIRSDEACFTDNDEEEIWGPRWEHNDLQDQLICMGGVIEGKWSPVAREGDSGGPAVCRGKDGRAVLCGVTSFGGIDELCMEHNNEEHCDPSGYAAVSYFHEWIVENAGPQPAYDPNIYHKPYLYGKLVSKMEEADHQVHITSSTGIFCGGTLIAKDVVVTAGHCVWDMKTRKMHPGLRITYGIIDLMKGGLQTFRIKGEPKLFPKFGMYVFPVDVKSQGDRVRMADPYYKNDLAVVKLNGVAHIAPERIPGLPKQGDVFRVGIEYAFPTGMHSTIYGETMTTRNFTILDSDDCQKRLDRLKSANLILKVVKRLICGVEKYSGGSTCDRELGGGLICKDTNGKDVLCGVQVFRLCEWSIPNGFINVAEVSNFIREAMASF